MLSDLSCEEREGNGEDHKVEVPMVFFAILCYSQSGDDPQEDLAGFSC